MNVETWAEPRPLRTKVLACAAITMLHAVVLVVHHPRNGAIRTEAPREKRTFLFVPLRAIPLARRDDNSAARSEHLTRKPRTATLIPPARPASPVGQVPANDAPVIEAGGDIDPNWTKDAPGTSTTGRDLRTYALLVAGKVDAQARQGKPAPLDAADTPLRRLQGNMAQATQGGATSTTITTSLSGEPITVIRRNGRARCYTPVSTSVAPSAVFDNRGSGRSTEVNCPKEMR